MGSPDSGYSIVYWYDPGTIRVTSRTTVRICEYTIQLRNRAWKVITPPLRHGAAGDVISIWGNSPSTWDTRRWSQVATEISYGGIIFAAGWSNLGNIIKPPNNSKKVHTTNKSRHSRPGPSYWKVAFPAGFRNGHRTLSKI